MSVFGGFGSIISLDPVIEEIEGVKRANGAGAPARLGAKGAKRGLARVSYFETAREEATQLYGPHNPSHVTDATYNLMRNDWTIGLALEVWRTAFANTEYWVEGKSPELNAFVEHLWERRRRQWVRVLLNALAWGRSISEVVWLREDVSYRYQSRSGSLVNRTRPGALVIGPLRDYDPREVVIRADKRTGDYAGFRLWDGSVVFAPEETIFVVYQGEFGNLRGTPLTHRSYSPWWWGNVNYLGANHYLERKGDPPLTGHAPSDKVVDDEGNEQDPIRVMSVAAANIRRGASYIMPGEFDPETRQRLYELREMDVAERAAEFLQFAQHYEALKALGCLTSPELVGIGGQGAFAKSKVAHRQQHNLFTDTQDGLIVDPANRWIVPKLVRANFGSVSQADMPMLRGGRLSENAQDVIAELVKDAQQTIAVLRDGRTAPVGSMIDWGKSIRQLGLPTHDDDAIPDDVNPQPKPEGRPSKIATNPNRPEGSTERGLTREPTIEVQQSFARDLGSTTAEQWFADADRLTNELDRIVNRADEAVSRARRAATTRIRKVMSQFVREAETTETKDGRVVFSTRNRRMPKSLRNEIEQILLDMDSALLDEKDIVAANFARRTPLAIAHTEIAREARDWLEEYRLEAPGQRATERVVRDVTRDGKTNSLAVPTREGRRLQEEFDRMVQGGADIEMARLWVENYQLPDRDLRLSTVSHVRGSARAMLSHKGLLTSDSVGGWVVMASPAQRKAILANFPEGRVSKMMFRSFNTAADLDGWYGQMVQSTGAAMTSWRNLGLHQFSEEYYLPVPSLLWAGVLALVEAKRQEWSEARRKSQEAIEGGGSGSPALLSAGMGASEGMQLGELRALRRVANTERVARLRVALARHGEALRSKLEGGQIPPRYTWADVAVALAEDSR